MRTFLPNPAVAILVAAILLSTGCFGRDAGGEGSGPGRGSPDAGPTWDCASPPPSQGLSEPCCPAHGVDACGAGLFCAAFDGRTQATCYAERSRGDGAECHDDAHCTSGGCHPDLRACRASPGLACTGELGCAASPDGTRFVCDPSGSTCVPATGEDGAACELGSDCDSRHCVAGRCTSGERGAACVEPGDCNSAICVAGVCRDGTDGSPCSNDAECVGGRCISSRCSTGGEGSTCGSDADCSTGAPYCVRGSCHDGWYGEPCVDDDDCDPDYPHCTAGACDDGIDLGEPCTSTAQCAQGRSDLGHRVDVICDPTKRTCVISSGHKCDVAWSREICETGTSCQPHEPGSSCSGNPGPCSGSYCCGEGSCYYACHDGWACLAS